jgi:phytoene dehydrogenase-like protein
MAGFPVRGWLAFAQAIEKRLVELGGRVTYQAKVTRLCLEGGAVKGVGLEDGSRIDADIVVSAADGRFTEEVLLGHPRGGKASRFQPALLSDQPAQVNLGVTEDFSRDDGPLTYLLPRPFHAAGKLHDRITVHNRYFDPGAAPKGASSLTIFLDSDYGFWAAATNEEGRYAREKERAAKAVVEAIESHRPGFAKSVQVVDVSTPITRERYTGNWRGAMQAFRPGSNLLSAILAGQRYQIRGLANFYMAGQWVEPWGGITTAAQSARKVIGRICRHDGRRFVTTVA